MLRAPNRGGLVDSDTLVVTKFDLVCPLDETVGPPGAKYRRLSAARTTGLSSGLRKAMSTTTCCLKSVFASGWCGRRDSNPHSQWPRDFKSLASTGFATSASLQSMQFQGRRRSLDASSPTRRGRAIGSEKPADRQAAARSRRRPARRAAGLQWKLRGQYPIDHLRLGRIGNVPPHC